MHNGFPMQPRVTYDGRYIHDWLKAEGSGEGDAEFTRRAATIKSGAGVLKHGTPLAIETATGKYVACQHGTADGSQTPVALLLYDIDATAREVDVAVIHRRAKVVLANLQWHASFDTAAKKAAAFALLAAREITDVHGL